MQFFILVVLLGGATTLLGVSIGNAKVGQEAKKTQEICASLVRIQEQQDGIPLHLLGAISRAESGRWLNEKQANIAWPWTVTSGGTGKFFNTKLEAIAEVELLITDGVQNIDVGCMQINLAAHTSAFETIEEAFNPIANVAYGAKYLKIMHKRTGNWLDAAGDYHSMIPHLSSKYRAKISQIWMQLLNSQESVETMVKPKPRARRVTSNSATHNYSQRLSLLNRNFHERLKLSEESKISNPVGYRLNTRLEQMKVWRRVRAQGLDLSVLESLRQGALSKRRKRELATLQKERQPSSFVERRRRQLDAWRSKQAKVLDNNKSLGDQ